MSEAHGDYNKFHVDNGQYVALLSHNGTNILMSEALPGSVSLLSLDNGPFSPISPEQYRLAACNNVGLSNVGTHIIDEQEFLQYPMNDIGLFVSLTIIETTSHELRVEFPLLWIDWKQNSDVFSSTTKHPAVSHCLRSYLDNLGSHSEKTRHFPWYCFGYYRRILPALKKHLQNFGYVIEGEPDQVNFSFHSSTYRIPSKTRNLFFKACRRGSNEMVVTQAISDLFPEQLAPLVGVIPELNGILTLDVAPTLSKIWDASDTEKSEEYRHKKTLSEYAMTQWARFQQGSVLYVSQLKDTSLPLCDEEWIDQGAQHLITYARDHELVSAQQLASLEVCDKVIKHSFALWAASGIPQTIVHGDLMESNIAQPGGLGTPVVVFDMDLACIAYPFFDLPDPVFSALGEGESAYLQCWESYTDKSTIKELAKRTKLLQMIREAVTVMRDPALSSEAIKFELTAYIEHVVEEIERVFPPDKGPDT